MRKINIMLMKALTAVGMLTAGITIQAQTYLESRKMEVFTPSCDNNQFDIVTKGNTKMYTRKVRLNAPCKEEAGEVTITFKLEYDAELYSFQPGMNNIRMFSDDEEGYINSPFMYGGEPYTVTVPTGTYDITATFNHAELGQPTIYIVKELVEILKDTTITMNPAEATNHIHVNNYAPDGTIFKKGLGYWDES